MRQSATKGDRAERKAALALQEGELRSVSSSWS